jgi:hypothetical protein
MDQACADACVTQFPEAGKAYDQVIDCQSTSCTEACVCGAADGDNACVACAKTSCCTEYGAFVNSPDPTAFNECLTACGEPLTQECYDACVVDHPTEGAAYDALFVCLESGCTAECAAP